MATNKVKASEQPPVPEGGPNSTEGEPEQQVNPNEPETAPPAPPTAWEPNTPPPAPMGPTAWEPNSPPPAPMGPTAWEPNTPPITPTAWEPNGPPQPATGNGVASGSAQLSNGAHPSAGGWVHHRAITHLWSYNASPGVWVWVHGIGWKRLSPASESGHSHLTMLALLAKNNRIAVSYHEDVHGQIDQLVV